VSALPQPAPVCASCGHALTGRFCAVCGEERLDFHNLSVRHFLAHTLHEVFELDGKIWLTLRGLLFRPAFLPSEYCGGRRRRYVNPFRLLITAAIAYALASRGGLQVRMFIGPVNVSLAPTAVTEGTSITATVERIDRFHLLRGLLAQREKSPAIESEAVRDKFHRQVEKFAEPLSFANVLLLAVMLYGLFGLRRKHFVEHGVFSMHFMSFVLFTALLFAPVPALMRAGWSTAVLPLIAAVVVWQFIYLVVAIRRFYFGPRIKDVLPKLAAGFGAVAVYFLNSVFITCVQTLGAALALWSTVP
jgi:hypothetical protein